MMDIHDYAESKRLSLNRIMDFTSDTNPIGPSNKAKNAVRKKVKHIGYPPDRETRYLKRLICAREGIREEEIIIGPDPAYILSVLLKMTRPKTALVPSPVSDIYEELLKNQSVKIRPFHLNGEKGFAFETGRFIKTIKDADLVLIPNPHNVVGTCLSPGDLLPVISHAAAMNKTLIIDETHRDFPDIPSQTNEITRSKTSIALRSFSTFYGLAGFRFGYAIGSNDLIRNIRDRLGHFPVNLLAEAAAIASLRDMGYRKRTLAYIEGEKHFIQDALAGAERVQCIDTPCSFLLLKLNEKIAGLRDAFLKRRIVVGDFTDKNGSQYIRLPVRKHAWNARFIRALKSIPGVQKPCSE
ncbi:MAG: aminotransferase class I/II-fold pyridoxal phosphate-dependent enzyme [Syntrophorhabdaceae bacterium]|nr:aminotransferase class I/II-fold pyridoxal phosphate-dependent enzyme [Syntrophorhabdaceae bacterium]MDD5243031.1 aminotransferase class I/II-fold pyridoxal phosphate-dependent enzyme [Syntrophorhabdaceae bacterium]